MKKKYSILVSVAIGLLAFTACSSENQEKEKNTQLSVTTDIATRSVKTGTAFSGGDEIGVYALNSDGSAYASASMNMHATYDKSWIFPNGSIFLNTTPATIYAYYPYASTNSTLSVPVDITNNATTGQTDYLYGAGTATVNSESPTAHIKFNHALTRLTFNIKLSNISTLTNLLTGVSLKNTSGGDTAVAVKGNMNVKTGSIKRTINTSATIDQSMKTTLDSLKITSVDMLVMPVNVNKNMTVSMVIDGKTYSVVLPSITFQAGNQYTYSVLVSIKDTRLTIGDCTITEWKNETASSTTVTDANYTNNADQAKIGDYLFNDGTWGALATNTDKTPIAVIFSNTTSTTDQGHGWTHGYAMALKDASTDAMWDVKEGTVFTNPTGAYITTTADLIADKDGYTKTTMIINSTAYPAIYFPAAYAAATTYKSTVAAPGNTSGWYLPSVGQWFDICVSLGGMPATGYINGIGYIYWSSTASTICAKKINAYLTTLTSGTYDSFPSNYQVYWCSSEYSSSRAYYVVFTTLGDMGLGSNNATKTNMGNARTVLAF